MGIINPNHNSPRTNLSPRTFFFIPRKALSTFIMRLSLHAATVSLAAGLLLPSVMAQHELFQGNSVLIKPSTTSLLPKDAEITSAHFYSYIAPQGYFSFGW